MDDREDLIRQRAYNIWEREGRPEGRQQEHWTQAESEQPADDFDTGLDNGGHVDPAMPGDRVDSAAGGREAVTNTAPDGSGIQAPDGFETGLDDGGHVDPPSQDTMGRNTVGRNTMERRDQG